MSYRNFNMCDSDGVFIKQVIGNEVYMFDSILLEFLITVFFVATIENASFLVQ